MMAKTMGFYVLFFVLHSVFAIEDYCAINTFNDSVTYMHFTKEASYEEFALVKKFKGLNCCAKGYRSIEWYKDDKLYPWALDVSNFIIYPESANQTIYTSDVREADAGNYTCVLKNDTVIHSHTIYLKVYEKVPDDPKITYISGDKKVRIGHSLRIFCEAFGGQVDLPDAYSEAEWKRYNTNGTIVEVPKNAEQFKTTREDGQTFGTYLTISNLKKEDFGQYVCIISKPGDTIERYVSISEKVDEVEYLNPNPVPVGKLILLMSIGLFSALAITILYLQFAVKIQVHLKDTFERPEENDGKTCDALILYAPQDSEISLGVLVPTLVDKYGYKIDTKELSPNVNMWYSNLKPVAERSRRIIFVLSPQAVNGSWESVSIITAIKQLQSLGPRLIVFSLKDLPTTDAEIKNSQGETLKSIARSAGVILWNRKKDDKFWYLLRLRMPARNRSSCVDNKQNIQGIEETRLSTQGQDMLANLV